MADLSTFVDADDPVVADLLVGSLELLAEAGGWLHPRARLVARDGQLALSCDHPDGDMLVRVPREAWVRVDRFTWSDDDGRLLVTDMPDDAGDIELQMAYLQAALHNQCGKLPWLTRSHPSLVPDLPDDVVKAVRAVVPSFRTVPFGPADVLWNNRCFRMELDGSPSPERVLVPVVDLLNHRRGGATGSIEDDTFEVEIRHRFSGDECALDYGMERDAMEMAVVYGFADDSTAIAHSAPLSVEVPGIGAVSILGSGHLPSGRRDSPVAQASGKASTLTHVTFDAADPHTTVTALCTATGWDAAQAEQAVGAIAHANIARLDAILSAGTEGSSTPAMDVLGAAAVHQRRMIASVLDRTDGGSG